MLRSFASVDQHGGMGQVCVSVVGSSEAWMWKNAKKKVTHFRYPRVLLPLSPTLPIYLYPVRRHRYHALPQSRTDGQNLNNSTFVQDRREAVRKIALSMMNSVRSARLRGPPRPPIGRERRDRERYRHEGTNYPPTIAHHHPDTTTTTIGHHPEIRCERRRETYRDGTA